MRKLLVEKSKGPWKKGKKGPVTKEQKLKDAAVNIYYHQYRQKDNYDIIRKLLGKESVSIEDVEDILKIPKRSRILER